MLQYLLNTTAIWLINLVLFDVFLRRESYHNYNRFYLLFTFLLGAFLPLWQWQDISHLYTPLVRPAEQMITAKQNIVAAATPSITISWEQWVTGIYLAGVLVALCLLIVDVIKLMIIYRNGKKSLQDNRPVIETGKEHAPFSFLNTLFVNSRQQYSADEWSMIWAHEQRHSALLHFADLLLMQLARVVFWFHPLVYAYNKRLLLVHEYQADNASAQQPQVYGRFLVEQAVLQSAPSITHSFNRSPIKKRIVMLTHRSTAASRIKMLVFIPLALVCIVCFSKNVFSQKFERKGNMVTYRGNTFEYDQRSKPDTVILTDPITGNETAKVIKRDPVPVKMNRTRIYKPEELTSQPQSYAENGSIPDYVFKNISKELNALPDGKYRLDINNIIIDTKGKIVFYEGIGLSHTFDHDALNMKKTIDQKIDEVLHNVPALKPGKMNNNNVIVLSDIFFMAYEIEVKDHKTTVSKSWK